MKCISSGTKWYFKIYWTISLKALSNFRIKQSLITLPLRFVFILIGECEVQFKLQLYSFYEVINEISVYLSSNNCLSVVPGHACCSQSFNRQGNVSTYLSSEVPGSWLFYKINALTWWQLPCCFNPKMMLFSWCLNWQLWTEVWLSQILIWRSEIKNIIS